MLTINQLGMFRLVLTAVMLVFALLLARHSWDVPLIVDAERALYDMRATVGAPFVDQDPRISMVTYNDEVLIQRRVRSPLDRGLLADALKTLDGMGAKAIGIDILFDQETNDDAKLIAQLRAMKTPTYVAWAEPATNPNDIQEMQAQFLDRFMREAETAKTRRASIRLETDGDDTARRWPRHEEPNVPLLAVAMAGGDSDFVDYRGAIRFRMPRNVSLEGGVQVQDVFENIPITTFTNPDLLTPDALPFIAEQVRGKRILIGGDIIGEDRFSTPTTTLTDPVTGELKKMIGLEVHAHMLAQVLDHARLAHVHPGQLWLAAFLAVLAGAMTAMLDVRPWAAALMLVGQMAIIAVTPFMLQSYGVDTLDLPVAGWGGGWLIAFIAMTSAVRAVGAEERAFAQSALGKYLPRDIAQEILRDPDRLALHGEKKYIYCLFSDLEGFTTMSHAMTPENVAFVLNAYLDTLSEVVLAHGGTIDKFVGDAVVAFWGAPIARKDDAEQAAKAMLQMAAEGELFRQRMATEGPEGLPPIGRTRVGLHFGEAVVGNFGGEGRIQYTALGDSMNTAARLESANKEMHTRALISREAYERCPLDLYVPMGRVQLRGRAQPVDVFEPRPDLDDAARAQVRTLIAMHAAGKGAEYQRAAKALASSAPDDESIMALIARLNETDPGGFYVLA